MSPVTLRQAMLDLLWLSNHYELDTGTDQAMKRRVLERIDRRLDTYFGTKGRRSWLELDE